MKTKKVLNGNMLALLVLAGMMVGLAAPATAQTLLSIGHWTFDDPAGSTSAADSSGTNNGICGSSLYPIGSNASRNLYCPAFGIAGRVGTAADFSGTNQGLRVNNTIPNSFTVTAWFKTTATGTGGVGSAAYSGRGIIWSDKSGGASDMIPMSLTADRIAFGTGGNGGVGYNTLTSTVPVNTGEWVCAAVTRDMTTGAKQLYINGQLDGSNTAGGTGSLDANPYIVFGANPLDYRYFDGEIDNIYFYDRVLSEAEIRGHCPLPATADAGGPYLVAVGEDVTFDGSGSTGGGEDPLTEAWSANGGIISGSTFTAESTPGIYEVSLVVSDGAFDSEPDTTTVVVYDPSGGFVTGGGWIDSPAGAYTPDGVSVPELGTNLANGDLTGGTARPVQVAAYDGAYVYNNNNGVCANAWQLAGTLCDEAPTTDSPTISSKTSGHSGATYSSNAGLGTGVLVVDLGAVQTFDQVNVFQMFSDGKTTHFRISTHAESGATVPDWQDAGWSPLNGFDLIGPGTYLGGSPNQVTDPTAIALPVTASRYVMVEVQNDGRHGNEGYIELRAFKLFLSSGGPLTGKASFGFNSKYKKGANVPTGSTEFQFKAGDFNFHSDVYEWLVVNQNAQNAQFKGVGTVNGTGNYGFMLWAGDGKLGGTADMFRIRIWNKNAGDGVVYDNGNDQEIGGGQVVIHTDK